jgi:hypothetical protein
MSLHLSYFGTSFLASRSFGNFQCVSITQFHTRRQQQQNFYILRVFNLSPLYRVSEEERLIFWQVTVSVILSKTTMNVQVSYSERFPR